MTAGDDRYKSSEITSADGDVGIEVSIDQSTILLRISCADNKAKPLHLNVPARL